MKNVLKKPCKSDTHVSSVHEGMKTLRCEMCGKTYFNIARLTEHITAIHEGKKPFRCDICDYRCFQKNDTNRHVDSVQGVAAKASAVGFCLGYGLFGSYNSL